VVVLDAGSGLGLGLAKAALTARRPVIAVARDRDALGELRAAHPDADLTLVVGGIADEAESQALAATLRSVSRGIGGLMLGHCGKPAQGRVLDQPADSLAQNLSRELVPQLAAARHLLPLLAEGGRNGTFVVVGSP